MSSASGADMSRALAPDGLRARAVVLGALRRWFEAHGYLEVPTPVRVVSPAMEVNLHALGTDDGWFLRTSPEFALKRVVSAGLPRVYEIGPCFRARERGRWHGTEFTMLEWYRVGARPADLMNEVESIVRDAAAALGRPAPEVWRRTTVAALFEEHCGLDLTVVAAEDLSERDAPHWNDAFFRRWVEDIEPHLVAPTFVAGWPASQAALARVHTDGHWPVAERFEVFFGGVELANAFFELTDAAEQRRRFSSANLERHAAGEAPHPVDKVFVESVGRMPLTSGIALGIDRLVAVLMGWSEIHPGRVP